MVNFRLEDGTLVKVHVEMTRAGVAIDCKAPDGSPVYNFNINPRIEVISKDKTYMAPAPNMPVARAASDKKANEYTS